jgi:methylene-fatty-acyl-phospholipid synthase
MQSSKEPLLIAAVTLSSLLYTLIWLRPRLWLALCSHPSLAGIAPTRAMALCAHALKALQFALCAALFLEQQPHSARPSLLAAFLANGIKNILPGAALLVLGQHLNYCVYVLLGEEGVYYGSKLGCAIPWVREWPYSHVRDPQYVGALASLLGAFLLRLMSPRVCIAWGLNYLFLMALESNLMCPPPRHRHAAAAAAAPGTRTRQRAAAS